MGSSAKTKNTSASTKKVVIIAAIIIALLLIAVIVLLAHTLLKAEESSTSQIGYATDATVMLDQDALQAAMDEAMQNAANNSVALRYQNNAFSDDGINFECYIANSTGNLYDMFLAIYADAEMTDQLFLSELIRPGSGFEKIKLNHTLGPGVNTVYVAATLVDTEEDGTQVIKSQVVHTMDFHVTE